MPAARHWVRAQLVGRYPAAIAADAELCVSELAANAVIHAGTDYEVCLTDDGEAHLRIAVADQDGSPLNTGAPVAPDAPDGRGLAIVAALTSRHGAKAGAEGGKVVWCTIAL